MIAQIHMVTTTIIQSMDDWPNYGYDHNYYEFNNNNSCMAKS